MSGHNKWSSIKHKKAAQDSKRGQVFTKLIREITISARTGGADPDANARLRSAISAGRAANMPKDNIERAIARGAGGQDGANIEEIRYEGYATGGVAIIIDCMTDNRNRTVSDVRSTLTKAGGNMGESGCVSWMFHHKGIFIFDADQCTEEELMDIALEAGAEDIEEQEDGSFEVYCAANDFFKVQQNLEKAGLHASTAELTWIPENTIDVEGEAAEKLLQLIEKIEDLDDVQNVYANFNISDAEIERIHS